MGQKQRKGAQIKGKPQITAVQSDNSKAPENAIGEGMEHSQKNAEPRTGALRMDPHEREEQILKIAAEHFARRGVLGASMSAIARDAGITRALLYHYFPGKDSLAAAVTRREANSVLEALGEHHENPEEALRRALRTYFLVVAGVPTPGGEDFPNNPRDQRTVRSRGLGLEEAIDLCLGAVDTLTGGY